MAVFAQRGRQRRAARLRREAPPRFRDATRSSGAAASGPGPLPARWRGRGRPSRGRGGAACTACRWGRAAVPRRSRWSAAACTWRPGRRGTPAAPAVSAGPGPAPAPAATTALISSPQSSCGIAEHGDVGDRRVAGQLGLDLGRVDVDPAGDDHVALAVAEEEVAVRVEVADVADGEHAAGPRGPRLLLVLVVVEGRGAHPHVDQPGSLAGTSSPLGVQHPHLGSPATAGRPTRAGRSHSCAVMTVPPPSLAA